MVPSVLACITTRDGKPDAAVHRRLSIACAYAWQQKACSSSVAVAADAYSVAACRNKAVAQMLAGAYTHLFFVDNDVLLQADVLPELLSVEADIAAGCYPSVKTPHDATMYVPYLTLQDESGKWLTRWFSGHRKVTVAGTGCMMIARQVLETISFPWFVWRESLEGGRHKHVSDDVDFCRRAIAAGFIIAANGHVRCGHMKTLDVSTMIVEEGEQRSPVTWSGPRTVAEQSSWPDYGSHVPALVSIGSAFDVRVALEYGSGRFSTKAFLNREYFPNLSTLVSYETDKEWFADTFTRMKDSRLHLTYCPLEALVSIPAPAADVVFIDCDNSTADGTHDYSARLNLLSKYEMSDAIIVVHDANFVSIAPAVAQSKYKYKTTYHPPKGPDTAVLSNHYDVTTIKWLDVPAIAG